MTTPHVLVIGAGMGGLAAALDLAASGVRVTLAERHEAPGGKMRELAIGGARIDSGPTVFTMRWIFEELFAATGRSLAEHVRLVPAEVLARHSWLDGSRLDLYADVERSVAAIGELAGAGEAAAYRAFAARSQAIFETLDESFMRREKPGPVSLACSMGLRGLPRLYETKPFTTLWRELGRTFGDPRLRQLFSRYSTYCGSSPFSAPATLMLIAHAERAGVWLVDGGMQRLAEAMAAAAVEEGAQIHYGRHVKRLVTVEGKIAGAELADGEFVQADAVVFNGDVQALSRGVLGTAAISALPRRDGEGRSLSAITWSMLAESDGFPLAHHTVFFGSDYRDEFHSIFERGTVTPEPTVYVCAQDRGSDLDAVQGPERLFFLINAPPREFPEKELHRLEARTFDFLARHGLTVSAPPEARVMTTPSDFHRLFPASDGALYGWPTHGWSGTFRRAGSRTRLRGLYLAGGTVHPGPGVPMAAMSGRLAAASLREDLGA